MYGILGEDKSDVATLKVLVRRLAHDDSVSIKTKGYGGCGEMLRKGGKQLKLFVRLGCNRLILCGTLWFSVFSVLKKNRAKLVGAKQRRYDVCAYR